VMSQMYSTLRRQVQEWIDEKEIYAQSSSPIPSASTSTSSSLSSSQVSLSSSASTSSASTSSASTSSSATSSLSLMLASASLLPSSSSSSSSSSSPSSSSSSSTSSSSATEGYSDLYESSSFVYDTRNKSDSVSTVQTMVGSVNIDEFPDGDSIIDQDDFDHFQDGDDEYPEDGEDDHPQLGTLNVEDDDDQEEQSPSLLTWDGQQDDGNHLHQMKDQSHQEDEFDFSRTLPKTLHLNQIESIQEEIRNYNHQQHQSSSSSSSLTTQQPSTITHNNPINNAGNRETQGWF